ncbi:hypothetical protein, partial [Halalkalibaculum sp. DA384]|uniref:hypothetical protein n=1 Tax=Halalkalibaculum sp. DA384 TaxID=3373606 RepID=UPI0037550AF9
LANIALVELFKGTDPGQMEQYLNGHHFRRGQSAGFYARLACRQQMAMPDGQKIGTKVIQRTKYFRNFKDVNHGGRFG